MILLYATLGSDLNTRSEELLGLIEYSNGCCFTLFYSFLMLPGGN